MKSKLILSILILTWLALILTLPQAATAGDGDLKWRFYLGGVPGSNSPAIAADGTIYALYENLAALSLVAVNPSGPSLKWACGAGEIHSSATVGKDGTIYYGAYYYVNAISPLNAAPKWQYTTGSWVVSTPAIGPDGTIYAGSADHYLYALDPNPPTSGGLRKWRYETGGQVVSSPAIGKDGTIYFGSMDQYVYALRPDGSLKWQYLTGGYVSVSPAIGQDGTIYIGSNDNNFYAFRPDGSVKWTFPTSYGILNSPAIGPDGTIYAPGALGLYAINPDGSQKWWWYDEAAPLSVPGCPAIGQDGTIYVLTNRSTPEGDGYAVLTALNPDKSVRWEYTTGVPSGAGNGSPTIAPDGTVYFGNSDYYLYAIETTCGGLAQAPWPMFHHDAKHTGQAPPYSLTPLYLLMLME